ncbi:TPR/glycosyl transferase domain protein [hydrothermal vent metagenome]|uniref:TPR/glycosyl transferase domain protein n=1 Tax=hydrothermal vent metagenome TaxID=652676 RepID=A0A3B0TIS1_9ZZZZ
MRKVLVITYYWPPAGGPGVQRWLKFVKYLRDFDIEPVVYVPENPTYPIQDESLIEEIPEGIKIYTRPIYEPYGLAKVLSPKKTKRISSGIIKAKNQSFLEKAMLWVRGNLFIPDARKYWVKPSVDFLSKVIEKEKITTIITTGPPHSVHLIGDLLKKKHPVNWVADFRDPWTSIGYHKKLRLSTSSQRKHKRLEQLVLNNADTIIVTSSTTKKEFEKLTPKPIKVITNGYDARFEGNVELEQKFTVSHIGSLLSGRNPSMLWQALSGLVQENTDFKNALELRLIGVVSEDVLDNIYGHGLQPYVKLIPYLSHEDALCHQRQSQVLLLVEINSHATVGIIPGKLFEYMAAKRPILGIGPKNWEVNDIVAETCSGKVFDYEARSELKAVILDWFNRYREGNLNSTSKNVEKYSRRELTKELAKNL